ncbi:MAG: hypothetical protein C0615_04770 [Desulfuromonas sp.]|nr:MAG: hypothetical protein C0615_04770 [Desulfuromonas sp.]
MSEIPELVRKRAEKTIHGLCQQQINRSGLEYCLSSRKCDDGFEISATPCGQVTFVPLARLLFSCELGQWTLHRPRTENRWSYVPEAGGALDMTRLIRYLENDPLNIFW